MFRIVLSHGRPSRAIPYYSFGLAWQKACRVIRRIVLDQKPRCGGKAFFLHFFYSSYCLCLRLAVHRNVSVFVLPRKRKEEKRQKASRVSPAVARLTVYRRLQVSSHSFGLAWQKACRVITLQLYKEQKLLESLVGLVRQTCSRR